VRAVLADTGPLYALEDPDDQFHERAREDTRRLERERLPVVIAYPTILEAYNLLLRRLPLSDVRNWLHEATTAATEIINPTPEDYRRAIERVRRYPDQRITLFDAVVATLSERLDVPVWTYDHHFDVMEVQVWR
jgi:predicted nucleic acid-binding protein